MKKTRNEYDFEAILRAWDTGTNLYLSNDQKKEALAKFALFCEDIGLNKEQVLCLCDSCMYLDWIDLEFPEVCRQYYKGVIEDIRLLRLLKYGLNIRVVSADKTSLDLGGTWKKRLIEDLEDYIKYATEAEEINKAVLDYEEMRFLNEVQKQTFSRSQNLGSLLECLMKDRKTRAVLNSIPNVDARRELMGEILYLFGVLEAVGLKEKWEEMGTREDPGTRGRKADEVKNWINSSRKREDKLK